jgi:hypothetical protein
MEGPPGTQAEVSVLEQEILSLQSSVSSAAKWGEDRALGAEWAVVSETCGLVQNMELARTTSVTRAGGHRPGRAEWRGGRGDPMVTMCPPGAVRVSCVRLKRRREAGGGERNRPVEEGVLGAGARLLDMQSEVPTSQKPEA